MPTTLVNPEVERYIGGLFPVDCPVLAEMEALARERRFPIIGPLVGPLLSQMAFALGATRVFEMGSGFGYSTLWFCRALPAGGVVHHTDGSEENSRLARGFLQRAGQADKARFHVGDAREVLAEEEGPFDIVYLDIDKHQYPGAFALIKERLGPGGMLIADNMLWDGRVLPPAKTDDDTAGIREFTRLLAEDRDFLTTIVPLRDGVALAWKRTDAPASSS